MIDAINAGDRLDVGGAMVALRHLLDERGIEWKAEGPNKTRWSHDGIEFVAVNAWPRNGGAKTRLILHANLTPEQAIEATLGRGECKMEYVSNWMRWHCKTCDQMDMAPRNPKPRCCKWCGRKVVGE